MDGHSLIIFEGPDASGKTTLAKWLASRTDSVYRSSIPTEMASLRNIIEGSNAEDSLHFYAASNAITYARLDRDLEHVPVVLDRSHISTVAYHSIMLARSLDDYASRIETSKCFARRPTLVFVTASIEKRLTRARRDRQDNRFFDISMHPRLAEEYDRQFRRLGWEVVTLDTTDMTIDLACSVLTKTLEEIGVVVAT